MQGLRGDRGAFEAEEIGKAVGRNRHGAPSATEWTHVLKVNVLEVTPIVVALTYVDLQPN